MKRLVFICVFVIFTLLINFTLWGALLLNENFDYTAGENLTAHNWTSFYSGGTNPITVSSGSLSFPNYISSGIGNSALVDNTGEDDRRSFAESSSGSIYASALVKVSTAYSGYFFHFRSGTSNIGRVFIKSGANFYFGLTKNGDTGNYTTSNYTYEQTYLIVLKYEFKAGLDDDEVSLYIFSSGDNHSTEPETTTLGPFSDGSDVSDIDNIALRQYNEGQDITVDGIRIATTWSEATLPVTLSTFTAQYLNSTPTLYWQTQSELDNMGWFLYRNNVEDFTSAEKITGMIQGHGTTTEPQSYIYEDAEELQIEQTYYYWLESVDYSGTIHHYDKVAQVTIPHPDDLGQNVTPPIAYDISADPNPFSYTTNISFVMDQPSLVDVAIYNVKGQLVKSFSTVMTTSENEFVNFHWNGKDNTGRALSNGVYLYSVKVNGKDYATKQLILMK